MSRAEIIPAILPMDYAEVQDQIELMKGFVKTVQIDACDGQFAPNPTWPYRKHDDSFERIVHEEEGLPGWKELEFEIDLMANKPEERVEDWVQAGATRIILHAEATGGIEKAFEMLSGRVDVGVAFDIDTDFEAYISQLRQKGFEPSFIQFMGIDNDGFQHQPFDDKVIGRVREARLKLPGLPISVDGGVSMDNARALIDAGADRLVVGSAIFQAENPLDAVEKLKRIAHGA